MRKELFKELTMLPGIAGHEKNIAQALRKHYLNYTDEIIYDELGSIFAVKRSKHPNPFKVMIAGHMDEVGFIVKSITEQGMLKIHPLGGLNAQTLLAHTVTVYPHDDIHQAIPGVIGSVPPHLLTPEQRSQVTQIDQMLVDIGVESKQEALDLGVRPGTMIVVDGKYLEMKNKNRILAKAWDNRYGCILGVELLEALKDVDLPFDLYIGATVQEEVGCRGAQTAATMIDPDLAIVLDASPANDMTGDKEAFGQLGKGVLIRFIDANMIPNQGFIHLAVDTCEAHQISYQYYLSMGGTDAGSIHKVLSGVPTLTACLCSRYIHTSHSIIDERDYDAAKQMVTTLLSELNEEKMIVIKESNR